MSEQEKDAVEILMFACAVVEKVAKIGEKRGFDGQAITIALAQALAMSIEMTGKPGCKQSIAADMAAIVAAFPPISDDQPMSEAIH